MPGFNNVYDGIDEFNETMKKVVDLVEEAKVKIQNIDSVSLGDASANVKAIEQICTSAKKQLDEATDIAEGVLRLLGR